jgi:hypothetical protein
MALTTLYFDWTYKCWGEERHPVVLQGHSSLLYDLDPSKSLSTQLDAVEGKMKQAVRDETPLSPNDHEMILVYNIRMGA